MQLHDFRALSFDCYGTLIDWETGIWDALSPLRRAGLSDRSAALAAFARHESAVQKAEPKASYPDVLARVHQRLSEEFEFPPDPELDVRFGGSVQDWPAFPDSEAALQYLGQHFRLIILSNVSRAAFTSSERRLGVSFDAVYTAEDIKRYKPDPRNFRYLIEHCEQDFGIGKGGLLHVAQSLYHDHVPARAAGLATAWIDRQQGQPGATKPVTVRPDVSFVFPDLAAFAASHRAELDSP